MSTHSRCHFVPPYLLDKVAASSDDPDLARCGHATLAIDQDLRGRRFTPPPVVDSPQAALVDADEDAWTVYTAENGSDLPGRPGRSSGEPATDDLAVDEAYAGAEASLALFREVYERSSYDGKGAPVVATVHYQRSYDNAFWDGRQLVFGDGDGRVFERFTKPIDVFAHELTHAVTQYTAGFAYYGQSGALNESVSDVFASCVKQRLLGQQAADADWLIGEGLFTSSVQGRALRSMAEPGTAYDDPRIGSDPQVGHLDDYVETTDDNGGVHLNSGIPNRAFYLAATGIGGTTWEGAARIWYDVLTGAAVGPDTDFAGFAQACVDAAGEHRAVVAHAWAQVGLHTDEGAASGRAAGPWRTDEPVGTGPVAAATVQVTRSGGFAGRTVRNAVPVDPAEADDDPRVREVRALLDRVDLAAFPGGAPMPDMFVYTFDVGAQHAEVPEQLLTPELSRLAELVLDEGPDGGGSGGAAR